MSTSLQLEQESFRVATASIRRHSMRPLEAHDYRKPSPGTQRARNARG